MSDTVAPWWKRFDAWWREQTRYLRDDRLSGSVTYHDEGHEAVWQGALKAAGRRWLLAIRWGPGTPFFPPRFFPLGCFSSRHQLADGSMCLVHPPSMEEGWRGVQDLGIWIERAASWFEGYARHEWAIPPEQWPLYATMVPGPEYRPILAPTMLVAIPPEWRRKPPGPLAIFRAQLPRDRAGMGAVVSYEAAGARPRRWEAGAALVKGEREDVRGLWCSPDVYGKREVSRIAAKEVSRALRRSRPLLIAACVRLDEGEGEGYLLWTFWDVSGIARRADVQAYIPQLAELTRRHGPWPGAHLDPLVLDVRRRLGRAGDVSDRLSSTWVLLAGLGSLGSEVAHLLAHEGVRRFVLIDGDVLLPENVARHRADLSDAGRAKVEAVRIAIHRVVPSAEVIIVPGWLDENVQRLRRPGDAPCIAIGMTGHEGSEHVLGDCCARLGIPALHAWLEMDGRVLRLIRAVPGLDPSMLDLAMRHDERPFVPRLATDTATACAEVVLPGSAANLHAAANFVTRVALDVAAGRIDRENQWLFAPDGIDSPDPRVHPALRGRYGLAGFTLSPEPPPGAPT